MGRTDRPPRSAGAVALFLPLVACGGGDLGSEKNDAGSELQDSGAFDGFRNLTLHVNVFPSRRTASSEEGAPFLALDQTVILGSHPENQGYDLGQVELIQPVIQQGYAEGFQVNPSVAAYPGEVVPIVGSVRLHRPDTVQTYNARSDASGNFELWAVPDGGYRLEIVPDDPLLPIYTGAWTVSDSAEPIDLSLDPGFPIYGVVTSTAGSVVGARIHVVDAFGAVSATAISDEFGLYQIRVAKAGEWTLVCEGRESGKDPTLTFPGLVVSDSGLNHDVAYPSDLVASSVEGQVQDLDGDPLIGATVRLTAESLVGYDRLDEGVLASWTTDVFVSDIGFLSPAPPGDYTLEVLPPDTADGDDLSPRRIFSVPVGADPATTEEIQLDGLSELSGTVRGPAGGLASALVTCRESEFGERAWSVFTGDGGGFVLDLPRIPVVCDVQPPGSNPELAAGFARLDPAKVGAWDITLGSGQLISGQLVSDTGAQNSALVEIRDQSDRLLGIKLTDADGLFSVPVDLSSAEE